MRRFAAVLDVMGHLRYVGTYRYIIFMTIEPEDVSCSYEYIIDIIAIRHGMVYAIGYRFH